MVQPPWGRDAIREDIDDSFLARPYRVRGEVVIDSYVEIASVRCDLCATVAPAAQYEGPVSRLPTQRGFALSLDALLCEACAGAMDANDVPALMSACRRACAVWNAAVPGPEALEAAVAQIRGSIALDTRRTFHLTAPEYGFNRRDTLEAGSLGEPDESDAHRYFEQHPRVRTDCIRSAASAFRARYGYAIPTAAALDVVVRYATGGIVDFAAGNGYWSYLLQKRGVTTDAMDEALVASGSNRFWKEPVEGTVAAWTHVRAGSFAELAASDAQTMLLIWPPGDSPMGTKSLEAFRGNRLIYAGERVPGLTGDAAFHAMLEQQWEAIEPPLRIPTLYGHEDELHVYARRA